MPDNHIPQVSSFPASAPTNPAGHAEAVVVGTPLTATSRGLYVGVTGDITVSMAADEASITFVAVPAGSILPIRVLEVTAASASAIVALY